MQFADIKNDIAFRKIFGNENKKEILISFLNAVLKLEGTSKINDIIFVWKGSTSMKTLYNKYKDLLINIGDIPFIGKRQINKNKKL